MKSFVEIDADTRGEYLRLLGAVSRLSGLFSESAVPFVNYRVAENIFCRSFDAENLSRSDSAFDAKYGPIGVGLKTFVCLGSQSFEKVAEFNAVSMLLSALDGHNLALKIAEYRNERIELAKRVYGISQSMYHIVARREYQLLFFETDYDCIDICRISIIKSSKSSLQFDDGANRYLYNFSKSTLYRQFTIPANVFTMPVEIMDDPYTTLLSMAMPNVSPSVGNKLIKGKNFVILPLYSTTANGKIVYEKSGLNQWNAGGRKRDMGEVYIRVPREIHKKYPDFFPERDCAFELSIPTGEVFSAKLCQDNAKALMTDPNKALSNWLLRNVFRLTEGQLVTIERMNELGFDSVFIRKISAERFSIDISPVDSYDMFIQDIEN